MLAHRPAADANDAPATFDPRTVATLRGLGTDGAPDAFVMLARLFVASGEELLETLRHALACGDDVAIGHVAHTLKGSAANLGAVPLTEACRQLEAALSSGTDVVGAADRTRVEFEHVQAWLRAEPRPVT